MKLCTVATATIMSMMTGSQAVTIKSGIKETAILQDKMQS